VVALPIALGSEVGLDTLTIPLKQSSSLAFGLSHLGKPLARWDAVAQEIVALATIDEVVKTLGLERLDFMKADIEGWELRLLRGARARSNAPGPVCCWRYPARSSRGPETAFCRHLTIARSSSNLRPVSCQSAVPTDGDFWFVSGDGPAIGGKVGSA
jgi:hypothetical protein